MYCIVQLHCVGYVCELCVDIIDGRGPPRDQCIVLYNFIELFMFVSCVLISLTAVGHRETSVLYCTTSLSRLCL